MTSRHKNKLVMSDSTSKKLYKLLKTLGFVLILVGVITLLSGNFLVPINFFKGSLSFLDFPSSIAIIMAGFVFIGALSNFEHKTNYRVRGIILSILMVFLSIFSFEVIYHFSFPVYLNYFKFPYIGLSSWNFVIITLILGISLSILKIKNYILLDKTAKILIVLFILIWSFWILNGFPQYFKLGTTYYPTIINIGIQNSYIEILLINFISKIIFMLIFVAINDDYL